MGDDVTEPGLACTLNHASRNASSSSSRACWPDQITIVGKQGRRGYLGICPVAEWGGFDIAIFWSDLLPVSQCCYTR